MLRVHIDSFQKLPLLLTQKAVDLAHWREDRARLKYTVCKKMGDFISCSDDDRALRSLPSVSSRAWIMSGSSCRTDQHLHVAPVHLTHCSCVQARFYWDCRTDTKVNNSHQHTILTVHCLLFCHMAGFFFLWKKSFCIWIAQNPKILQKKIKHIFRTKKRNILHFSGNIVMTIMPSTIPPTKCLITVMQHTSLIKKKIYIYIYFHYLDIFRKKCCNENF